MADVQQHPFVLLHVKWYNVPIAFEGVYELDASCPLLPDHVFEEVLYEPVPVPFAHVLIYGHQLIAHDEQLLGLPRPGCDDHVEVLDVLFLDDPGHLFRYGVGLVAVVELLVVAVQSQEYGVVTAGEKVTDEVPATCPLPSEFENTFLHGHMVWVSSQSNLAPGKQSCAD